MQEIERVPLLVVVVPSTEDDNDVWFHECSGAGLRKLWCLESLELEFRYLIGGRGRRVYLLVLRKRICSGYESMKDMVVSF